MTLFGRLARVWEPDFDAGRVVALPGTGSGIGREPAIELNRRGAHLASAGRREENLRETQKLCTALGDVEAFQVDVCDRTEVAASDASTVDRFGRCDVSLANAGILHVGNVESTSYRSHRRRQGCSRDPCRCRAGPRPGFDHQTRFETVMSTGSAN
ncbi:SDR family NAD(P)-dependent oxidoreductase [Nocardia sp. NPDC058633]|uniref:SDR family oxidoreductase n=1 Tax=Nocardia sp. NPDC058633 TaxID=3346568 RepID=UPI0036627F4C